MRREAAASLLAILLAGCTGGGEPPTGRTFEFETDDGIALTGEIRGQGRAGVVLAHAFPADRNSWSEFAHFLQGKGYVTLTFDFRGYGDSEGEKDIPEIWRDVLAAVAALRERGADRIVLIGASMGGTAALIAASRTDVNGVIALSAPTTFMELAVPPEVLAAIDEPKLFISSEGDGSAAESAQALYEQSSGAKRVEIVTGDSHGADLPEGGQAEVVRNLILQFLTANANT
jgi:pimeloyl-ACP methyl ester carboxylesterase